MLFLPLGVAVLLLTGSSGLVVAKPDTGNSADARMEAAREAAKGDALLEALLAELDRSKAQLRMDQVKPPYYIEYRVSDVDTFNAEAAFGGLRESDRSHLRFLRVVVRVGDYKQDSFYGQGMGSSSIIPIDDDPIALRRQIWLLTDEAYKNAADAYAEKLSALKQYTADTEPVDDFAKAPVETAVGETVSLKVDGNAWDQTLQDVTELYRQYPGIQSVEASARFTAVNEYFVNSEGTVVRQGRTTSTVTLSGATQASDGMRLGRSPYWTEQNPEQLPSREDLLKESKKMLDSLQALCQAPIVEESYRGPVLFAPDAANDIVAGLVGDNVLGRRPQLGRPNRTTGAFATSYKSRVLPKFVSVVDDPTIKTFAGKELVGSYRVDSEGVTAQPVTVVSQGMLVNYLTGREPLRDFAASNGHSRATPGGSPQPSLGVLMLKSSEPQSAKELNDKLRQMAQDEGQPYGYRVETLGPGNSPRLLYRVYVSDGHEELVRGAVFNELDVRALRNDLAAVGDDPLVSNRMGGLPQTVICPSLLFDELEVKRADTTKEKLPEYPAPELK
ncbi:MAG TPA: metallopeptidase TldD-related protein [Candidatus Eremiobacteraceae bacterium]|nr:metallopeptidase TldD-related protein [Candidatus Eremiobacteraceae bacterium]